MGVVSQIKDLDNTPKMVIWAILFLSIVRLKENCPDCRFEVSGAVRGYRPERKMVIWAILFSLTLVSLPLMP